jgi:hypothetical protein
MAADRLGSVVLLSYSATLMSVQLLAESFGDHVFYVASSRVDDQAGDRLTNWLSLWVFSTPSPPYSQLHCIHNRLGDSIFIIDLQFLISCYMTSTASTEFPQSRMQRNFLERGHGCFSRSLFTIYIILISYTALYTLQLQRHKLTENVK